jgi:4-hydroxybenzoate polyprenyltransferase
MHRYALYIRERFSPLQMLPLALLFGVAIGTLVPDSAGKEVEALRIVAVVVALLLFLFRLRLLDDIKDHQHDIQHHGERPGARGIVSQRELGVAAVLVAVVEGVIALQFGLHAGVAFLLMSGYSVALFLEALYHDRMRLSFTLYISIHELLLVPLLVYLFLIAGVALPNLFSGTFFLVVLYFAALFFMLEVARKLRAKDREGTGHDTYTAHYGVFGASALLASCAAVSFVALMGILLVRPTMPYGVLFFNIFLLVTLGVYLYTFVRTQTPRAAKNLFVASAVYVASTLLSTILLTLW